VFSCVLFVVSFADNCTTLTTRICASLLTPAHSLRSSCPHSPFSPLVPRARFLSLSLSLSLSHSCLPPYPFLHNTNSLLPSLHIHYTLNPPHPQPSFHPPSFLPPSLPHPLTPSVPSGDTPTPRINNKNHFWSLKNKPLGSPKTKRNHSWSSSKDKMERRPSLKKTSKTDVKD